MSEALYVSVDESNNAIDKMQLAICNFSVTEELLQCEE
jgi:hypothetical protein